MRASKRQKEPSIALIFYNCHGRGREFEPRRPRHRGELTWPHNPHNLVDALWGSINCPERTGNAIARDKNGCLPVCFNPRKRYTRPEMPSKGSVELCNTLATRHWRPGCRANYTSAIRIRDNIFGEESFQCSYIAVFCGFDDSGVTSEIWLPDA
jgi:hypothetical protein